MKTDNLSTKFLPTRFDEIFVEVVEYLFTNKKYIPGITQLKEFLPQFGITPPNYISIRNKKRGVPKDKVEDIIKILRDKYDVNEKYLRFKEGPILKRSLNSLAEQQVKFHTNQSIKDLVLENEHLKELLAEKERVIAEKERMIAEKERMIALQQSIIDKSKLALVQKTGEKTGK